MTRPTFASCLALLLALGCGEPDAGQDASPDANNASDDVGGNNASDGGQDVVQDPSDDDDSDADASQGCASDGACGPGEICQEGACVEGCRAPSDCPDGQTCRALVCVDEPCSLDSDCAEGEKCGLDGACGFVGAVECESDEACGLRWTCEQGTCSDPACERSDQCAPEAWCNEGVCERRSTAILPFGLERVFVPALDAHRASRPEDDFIGYGFGGGLFDMDGDGDLDLFVGHRVVGLDSPPCVLRNTSSPGALGFEPVEGLCQAGLLDGAIAGWAVDVDRDGRDELAVVGEGVVKLVRVGESARVEDLMALVPEDDPRRRCLGGSALPYDVDLDGWLDLIVACQGTDVTERDNLIFKLMPGGASAALMPRDPWDQLQDKGIDLALGALDVDRDGLVDLIVANDAFSTRFEEAFGDFPAGGVFRRCAPDEGCAAARWPFGEGTAESGSYMGVGNVEVDGQGEMIYLADWGPNRLLRYSDEGAVMDLAPDLGVELASDPGSGELLFAWGVVVEDFDRNGLDDLLVSQGRVYAIDDPDAPLDVAAFAANRDVILFQTEGGEFTALGQEVGLGPQTLEDSGDAQRPYASRGAVKVDLDGDGRLEILIAGMEGRFKLYTEAAPLPGEPARCTLAPSPLLVPAVGYGYEVAPTPQGPWKRSDVQGQLRLGASPWPTTHLRAGFLRFPSGATVPFDCAGGVGPVAVPEPPWLDWTLGQDGGLSVLVERPGGAPAQVEAALDLQGDGQAQVVALEAEGGGRWRLPAPAPRRFMLRLDGRWLPRWFVP